MQPVMILMVLILVLVMKDILVMDINAPVSQIMIIYSRLYAI